MIKNNYIPKTMSVNELTAFPIRELRQDVLDKLSKRIKDRGYNVAKSLIVVKSNDDYFVADGNHRLKVLKQQGITKVPCVVYEGEDIYKLAIEGNQDEDVYASMDLFDWLGIIRKLKDDGYTQQQTGDKIGWSRSAVNDYQRVLTIDADVLTVCKLHQVGRASQNDASATFDFNEYWFRTAGLYDIPKYQERLINAFISDKCNWNKSKVQSESAKYKLWQDMVAIHAYARGESWRFVRWLGNGTFFPFPFLCIDYLYDRQPFSFFVHAVCPL